jgi:AcrR family transcriptional regulator/DNA-binding PadR family transcriptional regulator
MAASEHPRLRKPVQEPRGDGLCVSELQRGRLLDATFGVVYLRGYQGMAVRAVAERAGVSSKTFYDLFADREDCFLAAFDYGVEQLASRARPAFEGERDWVVGLRAGLGAVLDFLDREPALRKLVFVEALGAGPRVLAHRAEVLQELAQVVDGGRAGVKAAQGLPGVIAEGIVGATFGVIHMRLLKAPTEPLVGLLGELMAVIVLPYRERAAVARELTRPTPTLVPGGSVDIGGGMSARALGAEPVVDFRLTVRSQLVLTVVGEYPGLSNQRVSELARISDQGQISRLMVRLTDQGLLENTSELPGQPKAWRLTPEGEEVVRANPPLRAEYRVAGGFTDDRTVLVLAAVSELGTRDFAPSNRQVSQAAGIDDQGQISKLLARLEHEGLLRNTGGQRHGIPNAWRLTPRGEEIAHATGAQNECPQTVNATSQATS